MHCWRVPSQHPEEHVLPLQHAVPGMPQKTHWP
jgi:hypothetical protein